MNPGMKNPGMKNPGMSATVKVRLTRGEREAWAKAFPPGTLSEVIRRSVNELVFGANPDRDDAHKEPYEELYKKWNEKAYK